MGKELKIEEVLEKYRDRLLFIPLGGVGEIGINCYLYYSQGKWLMIDLGLGFADDSNPGVEILLPSLGFIENYAKDIKALVITHAHEDHMGGISYLWEKIRCPIYITDFARELLESRLEEKGLLEEIDLRRIEKDAEIDLEEFKLRFISMHHSVPESQSLEIEASGLRVLHTGDWKFDDNEDMADKPDYESFKRLGEVGVSVVIGDSTSIYSEGRSSSEMTVRTALQEEISKAKGGLIVGCFASNIMRIESISIAAKNAGRKVCLVGRSLERAVQAAKNSGYLQTVEDYITDTESLNYNKNDLLYICTGSQGEKRSALNSISQQEHKNVKIETGDTVIFSSKVIPGNETSVSSLQKRLSLLGAMIITNEEIKDIHASGHPSRGDIGKMYRLTKPQCVIPVHGEPHHLEEHAKYAQENGAKTSLVINNGDVVLIAGENSKILSQVPTGLLAVDGKRLIDFGSNILRRRRKLSFNGSVMVSIVLDKKNNILGEIQISTLGLYEKDSEEEKDLRLYVRELFEEYKGLSDELDLKENLRIGIRRYVREKQGNKPETSIHLIKV